jgi:hypothetical protein
MARRASLLRAIASLTTVFLVREFNKNITTLSSRINRLAGIRLSNEERRPE